jgi:hypothetical protein
VDLADLESFFVGALRANGRRISREGEGISFKAPDDWRKRSWSVADHYSGLVFDRTHKGENAAGRVLGVGHQLVNLALAQALEAEAHLAAFLGLDRPVLIMVVEDAITGTGASVRRMIFGILDDEDDPMILRDWELLQLLNRLAPGRGSPAGMLTDPDFSAAVRRLAGHFQRNLPRGTALFVRPIARPEMLLLPTPIPPGEAAASSAAGVEPAQL